MTGRSNPTDMPFKIGSYLSQKLLGRELVSVRGFDHCGSGDFITAYAPMIITLRDCKSNGRRVRSGIYILNAGDVINSKAPFAYRTVIKAFRNWLSGIFTPSEIKCEWCDRCECNHWVYSGKPQCPRRI